MPDLPSAFLEIDLAPSDRAAGLIFDSATLGKFDTGEFAGGRGWVDVAADLLSASCERGISASERLYATADAGTLEADLRNQNGQYDPTNEDSPYWNTLGGHTELAPMRRVRVRVEADGVDVPPAPYLIWSGFADSFELSYEGGGAVATATLHATDALKVLANVEVALTLISQQSGSEIARILDEARWTARSLAVGTLTIATAEIADNAWAAAQLVAETELGALYPDGFGNIVFRDRDAAADELRSKWRRAVFAGSTEIETEPTFLPYGDVRVVFSDENIANDVTITRAGGLAQRSIDTASIARYLRRTFSRDDLLLESDADAAAYAALALDRLSTPELAITELAVDLAADSRLVQQAFLREIGDRIEVHVPAAGRATPISRTVFIRSVRHEWDSASWVTRWGLGDASFLGDGVQVAERSVALSLGSRFSVLFTGVHAPSVGISLRPKVFVDTVRPVALAISLRPRVAVTVVHINTTGPWYATSASSLDIGNPNWGSTGHAVGSTSGDYATCSIPSDVLHLVIGGISLPAGSVLDGLVVEVQAFRSGSGTTTLNMFVKPGGTTKTATLTGVSATYTFGGPTDPLGITAATIASGIAVHVWATGTGTTISVDWTRVTAYYH